MRDFIALLLATATCSCSPDAASGPRPAAASTAQPDFTANDARKALIDYFGGEPGDPKGPATLIRLPKARDMLREQFQTEELSQTDGIYFIAGIHFSVADKWYLFKLTGRAFFEDYRGEFYFDGTRWKAKPPVVEAIGHFKEKDD